jgi:hypothetical protein
MAYQTHLEAIRASTNVLVGPKTSTTTLRLGEPTEYVAVAESPVDIHRRAGIDRNTYALARCIRSEEGSRPAEYLLAVAEMVRNKAKRKGREIYQHLVFSTSPAYHFTHGRYGEQRGRSASTRQDPQQRHLAAAQAALLGASDFLPSNATTWFGPKLQDSGKQGTHSLNYDAVEIARKWGDDKLHWIGPLPGIDSYKFVVFKQESTKTDNQALVDMILAARGGVNMLSPEAPEPHASVNKTGVPFWLLATSAIGAALYL